MDKEQKTLKSPLSAKNTINPLHCEECKAKVAGEAQKSLAKQLLMDVSDALIDMIAVRKFLEDFIKRSQ